jgi:hypothetical protein
MKRNFAAAAALVFLFTRAPGGAATLGMPQSSPAASARAKRDRWARQAR